MTIEDSYGSFFLIVNQYRAVSSFNLIPEIPVPLSTWSTHRAGVMPSNVEEYLQKAMECEEKARAADQRGVSNSFRQLAEYWRALAKIVANKPDWPARS